MKLDEHMTDLQNDEYDRRFAGVAKIYGENAFAHYEQSHVIDMVGLWCSGSSRILLFFKSVNPGVG